jgi:hypothetical protein
MIAGAVLGELERWWIVWIGVAIGCFESVVLDWRGCLGPRRDLGLGRRRMTC